MLTLKAFGLITVFSVCTALGFLKSSMIKKRADKQSDFSRGAMALAERIRLCQGEIGELLNQCFSGELIEITISGYYANESNLRQEDISLLNEFLSNLGMGDIASEYERTSAYCDLIKIKHTEALEECKKLCRLYKSLGALFGIFICIFFM